MKTAEMVAGIVGMLMMLAGVWLRSTTETPDAPEREFGGGLIGWGLVVGLALPTLEYFVSVFGS